MAHSDQRLAYFYRQSAHSAENVEYLCFLPHHTSENHFQSGNHAEQCSAFIRLDEWCTWARLGGMVGRWNRAIQPRLVKRHLVLALWNLIFSRATVTICWKKMQLKTVFNMDWIGLNCDRWYTEVRRWFYVGSSHFYENINFLHYCPCFYWYYSDGGRGMVVY